MILFALTRIEYFFSVRFAVKLGKGKGEAFNRRTDVEFFFRFVGNFEGFKKKIFTCTSHFRN